MKKIEKLTPEHEIISFQIRDKWINKFFDTKTIDKKQFEKGIKWLYEDLLKIKNPKVIYCESWIAALKMIHTMKPTIGKNVSANIRDAIAENVRVTAREKVRPKVSATVEESTWDNVEENIWNNVSANVEDNPWANSEDNADAYEWDIVENNVWNNVWANIGDKVTAAVNDTIGDNIWVNVGDIVREYDKANVRKSLTKISQEHSNQTNSYANFGWVAFYDFFESIGVLDDTNFKKYKDLIQAGAFQVYEYENYVFAIQPPKNIILNETGQMHSIEQLAFEWSDGTGFYCINGITIKEDLFLKLKNKQLKLEDFLKEDEDNDVKKNN